MIPRFRHLRPLPGLLLLTLLAFPGAVTSHAAPTPGPDARELWVPRKNLAEALKSSPRSIVLTAEQFAALLRDSLARPASERVAPPVPAVLTEARYEGTPGERFVTFHAEFTVECLTADWTQVPLALHPRWLGAVRLDGESALQPSGDPADTASRTVILVRGKGRHSLSVDFALPVGDSAGRRGFTLPPPGAAGARLILAVPDAVKLESSAPFTRQAGGAVFALPAGPEEVRIAWSARDLAPLETGAVFQECRMRYTLDPARLSAELDLTWHSPLRPLPARLTLPLPAGMAVLGADGPDLLRWTLADGGLVLDFAPGARKTAALRLSLERILTLPDQAAALKLALPAPVAEGVFRASGQFSITASDDLRVRGVDAGPLAERDDSRAPADAGGNVFGTWIFPVLPHPPEVELQPLRVQFAATLDTQISLTREAVRLKRWLTLTPRDGTLFSPRLENLGAGEEIESVLAADGKEMPWKKTEAGLAFPGNGGLPAGKPWTVVVESRLDPPGWQNMTEQALTLSMASAKVPGAGKVNGYVALSFDESRQVVSQPVSGLEPRDPAQFAGTLPLTGQLAWSRLDDFQLNLAVSRRVPEYDAAVVFYALPLLNGLEVEGALTLSIDRSPLREIRVAFPAAAASSVRWDSPLLAESFLEPDNTWRLRFHQETDGRPSLRFRLSMPLTDATETAASPAAPAPGAPPQAAGGISTPGGGAAVTGEAPERRFTVEAPVLAVPGARRLSGTIVVEANTDTELTFTANGLNPLDTLSAPPVTGYHPSHRLVSAWTWPGGNPALTIHGVRHRPGSLVSTVVDRLVLDTVVSAGGPVRHQARLEVRTAGDQYLDVVLPPEARVLTLLVNDAVTKPVRNRQGGLRVPLPGPVAVIRVICECPGVALVSSSSSSAARLVPVTPDPALPVLDTQWRLHLPDGFSYSGFDSNLTETKQQQASAEAPTVLALVAEEGNFLRGYYGRVLPSVRARAMEKQTVAEVRERNARTLSILQANLAAQQGEVNEARQKTMRLMKLHGIVDMSLTTAGGGPTPFVGTSNTLYTLSKDREMEMRTQAGKFKANLESLSGLSGDRLIEGAMSYGVEDDTIKQFASTWRKDRVDYEKLTTSGFGKDHPKVQALAASIEKQEKILREAAENYKSTLSINIQNIEAALASVKDVAADTKTENLNSREYIMAKQAWGQKLELLNRMRETVLKTVASQETLRGASGDQPYGEPQKEDILPGAIDAVERNDSKPAVETETTVVGKPVMETRTFTVPENFLASLTESGTFSTADATAADPFAVGTNEGAVAALAVKPTAGSVLSALGMKFEDGATATFSAGTGTLVVRNTPDQLAFAALLLRGVAAGDRNAVGGLVSSSDREGILPLDFALPEGGRVYVFDGQYPPGTLTFRYESWRNQVRWSWLWIALGGLGFRLLGGWRGPWFMSLVGALVLQIGPGVLGRADWLPVTNALMIGWLLAAAVRVIFGKALRPRRQSQPGGITPAAGVFPSPQVLSALLIGSVLFSGSLFCPNAARGQESPPPPPAPAAPPAATPPAAGSDAKAPEPPTVIVPFDPDKPAEAQSPERRYLDYATFQRMWTAAKTNRALEAAKLAAAAATGERAATLTSALHRAEADGRVLRVESVYVLLTRGPDWTGVPFALESGLKSLSLDGAPAALKDGQLLVEKAGAHRITASYELPLPSGWQEAAWRVPVATASSLALSLAMDDPARPVVNDGAPVVETEADGRRVFTAPLGTVSAISLKRRTVARRAGGQAAEPSLARVTARVFLSPALERVEASVDYRFAGQERAEFSLSLDPGLTPVSFSVPGLENWTLRREAGAQVLDFRLERPARDAFSVSLVAERPVGALPLTESAPLLSAAAARVEREWSVLATNDVGVRPLPAEGLHRVNFKNNRSAEQAGFDAVGTWQAAGHADKEALLRWELRPQVPEASAVVRYALQPGAGKLELSAGLELHPAADRELRDLTIRVPEGSTVQGVSGDRLADWWHEGTALHVRFERSPTDDNITRLALNLTRPLAAGAADFSFSPLVIGGFSKVSGSGLLIAPVNQETTLALAPAAPALREVAPEAAAAGFSIRPPFEPKRGFVFSGSDWTATASLKPLAARYDIDWVMDAEVRDSWVELNTRVLLALTRGGVEGVEFTTPAGAPEFRVTGEGLRGTVSAVEGSVRRYTVSFQSLRTGTALFTLTGQMPLVTMAADGGPGLPDIDFAGAARVSRFVIVDNKSAGGMRLRLSGMDITPREQVSLLPAELVSGRTAAQFYRARPGWSMRVAVEKLETSAGQAAVVLQADLTTSLLRNGDVWQRAVYVLANRSLQFLPVHLPEGAEVVSVVVGDEATRADSGVVDGLPVLLVPLVQTAPGELAMEVKLIYRLRGRAALAGGFPGGLDDPELPGISVGQTFWTVQYPDGFTLEPEGGNMTRVEDGALSGEKAASRLTEIGSLRSIAESENYDRATRVRARENVRKLAAAWRELLPTGRGEDYPRILNDSESGPFPAEESPLPEPVAAGPEAEAYRAKEFVFNKTAGGNAAAAASTATLPPKVAGEGQAGKKLSLNDHVSWAFESRDNPHEKTPPGRSYRRVSQISRLQETGSGEALKPAAGTAGDATKDRHTLEQRKQQDFDTQNGSYSFGNARLNNSAQAVTGTRFQDGPAAGTEAKKSAAAPSPGQPQSPASVNRPAGNAAGREDVKDAQSGDDGRDKDDRRSMDGMTAAGQARLRTTGRVSLDAVFPAQAREMHFRKMKSGAVLQLRLTDQTGGRGVNWGGVTALTAGLAVLFGFRTLHRRTR